MSDFIPVPEVEDGDYWTAAQQNTYIRDNLDYLYRASLNPGLRLYSQQDPGIGVSTFIFTSIPTTYENLQVVIYGRGSNAALSVDVAVRFNSDSGINYGYSSHLSNGTTDSRSGNPDTTYIVPGLVPAASAPSGLVGSIKMWIMGYKGTTLNKGIVAESGWMESRSSGGVFLRQAYGFWASTAAINRIEIYPVTGNFMPGTVVSIYGGH